MTPFMYGCLVGLLWIAWGVACFLSGVFYGQAAEEDHRQEMYRFIDEIKRAVREEREGR